MYSDFNEIYNLHLDYLKAIGRISKDFWFTRSYSKSLRRYSSVLFRTDMESLNKQLNFAFLLSNIGFFLFIWYNTRSEICFFTKYIAFIYLYVYN
jgi:hypothetical protein